MTWIQSINGNRIDLINPTVEQVDFAEIAETLARINRYNGASKDPVSVAMHTLIACDAAPEELKPWVLLHDAHEARLGDITTPMRGAIMIIEHSLPSEWKGIAMTAISMLCDRHDIVIHEAAGLCLPHRDSCEGIRFADLRALQTERRDFLAPCVWPWTSELDDIEPLPTIYVWRPIEEVADELFRRFCLYLPVLKNA